MPRKPKGRRHCSRPSSFSFPPFGLSMALLQSSGKKVKHNSLDSKLEEKTAPSTSDPFNYTGNGLVKDAQYSDSSDDGEFEGVFQAYFAFFDPKPKDFHGVQVLLQTYLNDKIWDLTGFVDLILEQTNVGTVVKIEDDEDEGIYGFVTAFNLGRYKAHEVGLLVSQHIVNLPSQLLPPIYDGLFDEVKWATKDEVAQLQNKVENAGGETLKKQKTKVGKIKSDINHKSTEINRYKVQTETGQKMLKKLTKVIEESRMRKNVLVQRENQ